MLNSTVQFISLLFTISRIHQAVILYPDYLETEFLEKPIDRNSARKVNMGT